LINDYNKKLHTLNEDLKKMMFENEQLQNKIKSGSATINKQKEEIERLKKNSQLNFKMIKEDNENLMKQINLLNDNFLQIEMKKKEEKNNK
jgi:predicted  nucleic acid-binding Zn-ribbon protein